MKGTCRACGCTDLTPCVSDFGQPCAWVTADRDLCNYCADLMEDGIAALQRGMFGPDGADDEPEPLVIPVREYEAQRFIDERRRAMAAGGGR